MGDMLQGNAWPVRPKRMQAAGRNEWTERIARTLRKWVRFADGTYADWNGRARCGHFFGGTYWYGIETAHTSFVYAVLCVFDGDEGFLSGELLEERAIRAIRYLGFTHDTGPADCMRPLGRNTANSGNKWGGRNDRYFMATQTGNSINYLGMAAWLLWDRLDDETRMLVQQVVGSFADRWMNEEPRSGTYYDTQIEENAWTAIGIFTAALLFPEHPHHDRWWQAYHRWNVNSLTTYRDCKNNGPSRGVSAPKRVSVVTLHPDYSTENHGFVHPTYMTSSLYFRGRETAALTLAGMPFEAIDRLNDREIYERALKPWSFGDAIPVSVQGQDWWYNQQHAFMYCHTFMNVLYGDSDAALLEERAMTFIEAVQASNTRGCYLEEHGELCDVFKPDFQTAIDVEHMSAVHLANALLLRLLHGEGAPPADEREMARRLSGVYSYPFGGFVLHRTPDTVSTFSWRNHVMGMTLSREGGWMQTPLYESCVGTVRVAETSADRETLHESTVYETKRHDADIREDGFAVYALMERGTRDLLQHAAFVSLPDGRSVYFEQFEALAEVRLSSLETGTIGIRNEYYAALPGLADGARMLYLPDSAARFESWRPHGRDTTADYPPAAYVNIDDKTGYLLYGSEGIRYFNPHTFDKWKGGEDKLILNRRPQPAPMAYGEISPLFAIVALPNRTAAETAESHRQSHWFDYGRSAVWTDRSWLVWCHFATDADSVVMRASRCSGADSLFPGTNRLTAAGVEWHGTTAGRRTGYLAALGEVRVAMSGEPGWTVDIVVNDDKIIFLNKGPGPVALRYSFPGKRLSGELQLAAGTFADLEGAAE